MHTHTHTHTQAQTHSYREVAGIVLDPFRSDEATNGKPCGAIGLVTLHDGVAPGDWHVVNHPLVHVALMDPLTKEFQFCFVIFVILLVSLFAKLLALCLVLSKFNLWEVHTERERERESACV